MGKKRSRIGHGQSINSTRTAALSFEREEMRRVQGLFSVFLPSAAERSINLTVRESQRGASGRAPRQFFALKKHGGRVLLGNLSNSIMDLKCAGAEKYERNTSAGRHTG